MAGLEDYSFATFVAQYRNPQTAQARTYHLRYFEDWLAAEHLHVLAVQPSDVLRFIDNQRETRAESTAMAELRSLRAYYLWLEQRGIIQRSPVAHIKEQSLPRRAPKSVPIEDIRRLLAACTTDRNWAFLSIIAFNSLRVSELLSCDVPDFQREKGRAILHFKPNAESRRRRNFVVLVDETAEALERHVAGRRNGPLFVSRQGNRMNRSTASNGIFTLTGNRAGLDYKVTPDMLTNSLTAAALREGFSFRGIVRAIGVPDRRHSERWVGSTEGPEEDNASLRFARLVLNPPDTPQNLLLHVESLLLATDLPEPFAVAAAGSIVERHLRLLAEQHGIAPQADSAKGGITYYTGELQRRNAIKVADGRRFRALGDLRNDAAHGWYERVPTGAGARVIREARELIATYPISDS